MSVRSAIMLLKCRVWWSLCLSLTQSRIWHTRISCTQSYCIHILANMKMQQSFCWMIHILPISHATLKVSLITLLWTLCDRSTILPLLPQSAWKTVTGNSSRLVLSHHERRKHKSLPTMNTSTRSAEAGGWVQNDLSQQSMYWWQHLLTLHLLTLVTVGIILFHAV